VQRDLQNQILADVIPYWALAGSHRLPKDRESVEGVLDDLELRSRSAMIKRSTCLLSITLDLAYLSEI
jgi:hypothetical protein